MKSAERIEVAERQIEQELFRSCASKSRSFHVDNIPNGVYCKSRKRVQSIVLKGGVNGMAYGTKTANRVKRIEGQLRGVLRMMEEEKNCKDVITQLSAVRSAVDRTIGVIVSENLLDCVTTAEGDAEKMNEVIREAMDLVVKSR
jgi:DNA-binding FrmR family transcriptional regulator